MKTYLSKFLALIIVCLAIVACDSDTVMEDRGDSGDSIATEPDYEDSGASDGEGVDYEDQSARSSVTTNTTNYADRADSIRASGDTLVKPIYTDNEYEAAYSTATTNPKNQVEGGVKPSGSPQRKQ